MENAIMCGKQVNTLCLKKVPTYLDQRSKVVFINLWGLQACWALTQGPREQNALRLLPINKSLLFFS